MNSIFDFSGNFQFCILNIKNYLKRIKIPCIEHEYYVIYIKLIVKTSINSFKKKRIFINNWLIYLKNKK